jgi:hypothetical protein
MYDKIVWENQQQKILWDEEMSGQVSDGQWENSYPYDHWERPCKAASMVVGSEGNPMAGLNFYPKRSYGFNKASLLEIVGQRALEAVQAKYPDYTWRDMQLDLRAMGRMFREARDGKLIR